MKKYDNEIVARVISQYIGQEMLTNWGTRKEIETITGVVGNVIIFRHTEEDEEEETDFEILYTLNLVGSDGSCKLILTPLSKITDEHATELAIMVKKTNAYWVREKFHVEIKREKGWICLIVNDGTIEIILNFDGTITAQDLHEQSVCTDACIYQYLQSLGYDMPQFILDGQTAIEAGIAVDKTLIEGGR